MQTDLLFILTIYPGTAAVPTLRAHKQEQDMVCTAQADDVGYGTPI